MQEMELLQRAKAGDCRREHVFWNKASEYYKIKLSHVPAAATDFLPDHNHSSLICFTDSESTI